MLRIYRRHRPSCKYSSSRERKCSCPVYTSGTLRGVPCRKKLNSLDWMDALKEVAALEISDEPPPEEPPKLIAAAGDDFIGDCMARGLRPASVQKNRVLISQLTAWGIDKGVILVEQLSIERAREFRASWKDSPITAYKKLERFKAFLRFCASAGWCGTLDLKQLKPPIVRDAPTLPFTADEMDAIIKTINAGIGYESHRADEKQIAFIRAFVLLMRYSGLRISDALKVGPGSLLGNRLRLRTQKTGTEVQVPLPEFVVKALHSFPPRSKQYFFWSGNGQLETARKIMNRSLARVFGKAKIKRGHAHRFRDTFSVDLLTRGVALETVSTLLGHSSIRVTEKHYSAWVPSRQAALEAELARAGALESPKTAESHPPRSADIAADLGQCCTLQEPGRVN